MRLVPIACKHHPDAPLVDDFHAGDVVCSECGLVVGDRVIDVGSEWRTFGDDSSSKDNSRVGQAENNLYSEELTTHIEHVKGGPRIFNQQSTNSQQKALKPVYKEISNIAERLNLVSTTTNEAKSLFKRLHETNALKRKNTEAMAAACIHLACQKSRRTAVKEILGVSSINSKEFHRSLTSIKKVLQIASCATDSTDYMPRFCARLNLPKNIESTAKHVASKLKNIHELQGRQPMTLVAASIYLVVLATGDQTQIKEISVETSVAESTIKASYKIMMTHVDELFPENFQFVVPISRLPR